MPDGQRNLNSRSTSERDRSGHTPPASIIGAQHEEVHEQRKTGVDRLGPRQEMMSGEQPTGTNGSFVTPQEGRGVAGVSRDRRALQTPCHHQRPCERGACDEPRSGTRGRWTVRHPPASASWRRPRVARVRIGSQRRRRVGRAPGRPTRLRGNAWRGNGPGHRGGSSSSPTASMAGPTGWRHPVGVFERMRPRERVSDHRVDSGPGTRRRELVPGFSCAGSGERRPRRAGHT